MMIRLLFFAVAVLFTQVSFAATYKCVLGNGKVTYQATPCPMASGGSQSILSAPSPALSKPANTSSTKKKCTGKEISIDFHSMPLANTLQVIADASGNKLSFSPRLAVSGAFHYVCVPWDAILNDIAAKYKLSTRIEAGTIFVLAK
jgi:hypothetical protein